MHICPLDKQCRSYGAPWRIYGHIGKRNISVALRPRDGFVPNYVKVDGDWVPSPEFPTGHFPVWHWRRWIMTDLKERAVNPDPWTGPTRRRGVRVIIEEDE